MGTFVTDADIRYTIVGKDETDISIEVCYWADGYDFRLNYKIDLPVDPVTSAIPSGDDLKNLIMFHAPIGQLDAKVARFKSAVLVNFSEIDSLIVTPPEPTPAPT